MCVYVYICICMYMYVYICIHQMCAGTLQVRVKCLELQAAHDVLLEQQGLYKDLLSAADKQHKRLQVPKTIYYCTKYVTVHGSSVCR